MIKTDLRLAPFISGGTGYLQISIYSAKNIAHKINNYIKH